MNSQPSADQTPAAAPIDPSVTPEVASTTTAGADKGKTSRKRTSVRGLRNEIAGLEQLNKDVHESNNRLRTRLEETRSALYKTEDGMYEATEKATVAEATVVTLRTALEFVLALLVGDKSPTEATELLPKKAREFGFDFNSIQSELLDALGKAYAKAPQRAVKAGSDKALAELEKMTTDLLGRRRPGSPFGGLLSILGPDPTRGMGDPGDNILSTLMSLMGDGSDCGNPDCPVHGRRSR